jgi:hypothetical protein
VIELIESDCDRLHGWQVSEFCLCFFFFVSLLKINTTERSDSLARTAQTWRYVVFHSEKIASHKDVDLPTCQPQAVSAGPDGKACSRQAEVGDGVQGYVVICFRSLSVCERFRPCVGLLASVDAYMNLQVDIDNFLVAFSLP